MAPQVEGKPSASASRGAAQKVSKPATSTHSRLGGLLAILVAATAIGLGGLLAASSSFGGKGLQDLRQDLTTSASAFLRSFNISMPSIGLSNSSAPSDAVAQKSSEASCTCSVKRLSGVVNDCCCEYETVDRLNLDVLQPLLKELVAKPFFRYFKLRLWCDCPFWREDGMCHSRDCSVGECTDEEVPGPLKLRSSSLPARSTAGVSASEKTEGDASTTFSAVDLTVDHSAFRSWVEEDNPWTHDNEANNEESTYVNLALNPERYTGYKGDSARRIWEAIYQESCFQDGPNDTCRERRVFYRLISGFHMSITVHVSTSFLHDNKSGEWGPHLEMFKWRVANFPDRLANLYFTFLFVLRAAMKASDYLSFVPYDTGNPTEDKETVDLVRSLVAHERLKAACPLPFDEAELWKGAQGPQLFSDLQRHFRNISAIMDCVGCERCRLWGKLEILGIATALKILFSEDGPSGRPKIALQRNEVTALINTLSRFSEALASTSKMMSILERISEESSGSGKLLPGPNVVQKST